jgi:hypothetical protein
MKLSSAVDEFFKKKNLLFPNYLFQKRSINNIVLCNLIYLGADMSSEHEKRKKLPSKTEKTIFFSKNRYKNRDKFRALISISISISILVDWNSFRTLFLLFFFSFFYGPLAWLFRVRVCLIFGKKPSELYEEPASCEKQAANPQPIPTLPPQEVSNWHVCRCAQMNQFWYKLATLYPKPRASP